MLNIRNVELAKCCPGWVNIEHKPQVMEQHLNVVSGVCTSYRLECCPCFFLRTANHRETRFNHEQSLDSNILPIQDPIMKGWKLRIKKKCFYLYYSVLVSGIAASVSDFSLHGCPIFLS